MHILDLSSRLRVVADEDPEPMNPRTDAESPVGVFVPLDYWFNNIPELHRFPGPLQRAHDTFAGHDVHGMETVCRWAWIFYNVGMKSDGLRYWFVDPLSFRALVDDDLSREHQLQVIDQERGAWFTYAKEPAWQVWLERKATFRRSSKHWVENTETLLHVWEPVSEKCGSLYLDASVLDSQLAYVVKENFGGLLMPRERAAVEALIDSGRALS